jgi:PEP-CTERM motif
MSFDITQCHDLTVPSGLITFGKFAARWVEEGHFVRSSPPSDNAIILGRRKQMKLGVLITAAIAATFAGEVRANTFTFDFTSTSGPVVDADLQIVTTDVLVGGYYQITGITGDVSGPGGAGPAAISDINTSYGEPDNLLSPTSPYLDFDGMAFDAADGISFNVYYNSGVYDVINTISNPVGTGVDNASTVTVSVTEAPAQVPEPATLSLLGLGLAGLGFARRRQARSV